MTAIAPTVNASAIAAQIARALQHTGISANTYLVLGYIDHLTPEERSYAKEHAGHIAGLTNALLAAPTLYLQASQQEPLYVLSLPAAFLKVTRSALNSQLNDLKEAEALHHCTWTQDHVEYLLTAPDSIALELLSVARKEYQTACLMPVEPTSANDPEHFGGFAQEGLFDRARTA